jgi:hypothetical protein
LSDPDDPDLPYQRKKNTRPGKTVNPEALKAELKALLREPLMARGVSARYPTSGSKVIIDDLLGASGESLAYILIGLLETDDVKVMELFWELRLRKHMRRWP